MSSQKESYQHDSAVIKSKRAQLRHALLDINFKDKPKVLDLEGEFGPLARLLVTDLICSMSGATEARVSRGTARVLGVRIGLEPERTGQIIEWCLEQGILLLEDGYLANSRVIKDQESYGAKLESDRKRKSKEKIPTDGERNEPGKPLSSDSDIDSENGSDPKEKNVALIIPHAFDTPDVRRAFNSWAGKLKQIGRTLDEISIDNLCKRFGTHEKLINALVYSSSLSKCANPVDPPPDSNGTPKLTNAQKILEMGKNLNTKALT